MKNSKIKNLLEKYMLQEMDQNDLISKTKKIFYDNLKFNRYNIGFIEEYFFITEILCLSDCSKTVCDNYVRQYLDVYNGKKTLKTTISVILCKECLSEEVLNTIFLIKKIILKFEISEQEKSTIKCFLEKDTIKEETLYDYVINQLKNIFQWGFVVNNAILYEPKSILYICDEAELKTKMFEKIQSIISVLLENEPIWITCIYENGECSLQVII